MKFLTGLSVADWLKIGAAAVIAALALLCWTRGNTIDDLRQSVATERAAHAVTKSSLVAARGELDRQNAEIEAQRANIEAARRDLAQAETASAGSPAVIDRLTVSARDVPAGPICEAPNSVKEIWK